MPHPLRTDPASLARMRRSLATLDDPVAFAQRYLRLRGFARHARDFDDLLEVAVESLVKAGLSWGDDYEGGGVSFTTWVYRYMDREVIREISRDRRRMDGYGYESDAASTINERWLAPDNGTSWYRRIEDRIVIHDLIDRANLSDRHRFILEFAAVHGGTDGPPPKGHEPLGDLTKSTDYSTAMRRVRKVLAGGELDDEWARARAGAARARDRFEREAQARAERHRRQSEQAAA